MLIKTTKFKELYRLYLCWVEILLLNKLGAIEMTKEEKQATNNSINLIAIKLGWSN